MHKNNNELGWALKDEKKLGEIQILEENKVQKLHSYRVLLEFPNLEIDVASVCHKFAAGSDMAILSAPYERRFQILLTHSLKSSHISQEGE